MSKSVTFSNINQKVVNCRYEVRGEIYLAAVERTKKGKRVIYTNVGNPQGLGQQPLSFNRYVMSLLMAPMIMDNPYVDFIYPPDAISRAKTYLKHLGGGLGAYSDSKGNAFIRQEIADSIERSSGFPSNPDNIFISNGASECVRMILYALIRGEADGIMIPIPQYPLYSASIGLYGGSLVGYYLDEEDGWSLSISEMQKSLDKARSEGILVRAMVFINPGNPTGQCLTQSNLEEIIRFCYQNKIVLMADEVYQENSFNPNLPFISARKTLGNMPDPIASGLELCSFHTVSKGVYGECGLRGGYMEMHNFSNDVVEQIYKTASINLCPNVPGQVALGLMVNPPKPGDHSYMQYMEEKDAIHQSLRRRAKMITDAFNALEGVDCQETDGALYSFPKITIPTAAIEKARSIGKEPDIMYCLELLDETGLSCVPGSGFKQKDGTFHIRTTILPPEEEFDEIVSLFTSFHKNFMKRYGNNSPRAKL